jgi:hypothetical protein
MAPRSLGKPVFGTSAPGAKFRARIWVDHLKALARLVFPFADDGKRRSELRGLMEHGNLKAHVTCFWRGPPDADASSIPTVVSEPLHRIPADIQVDFATE